MQGVSAQVAVIGAGPSGAMAALHLARSGVDVRLIDRYRFPREKVCGDGLISDAQNALDRVGLLDQVIAEGYCVEKSTVFSPGRIEADFRGRFVTLPRRRLDQLLVRAACERGARLVHDRVTGLALGRGGVRLSLAGSDDLLARYAIVATGTHVGLLEQIGALEDVSPSAFAFRRYFSSERNLDRLVVSYDRSIMPGYAWAFPVGDKRLNVGLGVTRGQAIKPRRTLDRFVREFPLLRDELGELTPLTPLRGSSLRWGLTGARPVTGGRVLAAGDAVGATFPFTGEGIGKAMETGEIAAEVLRSVIADGDTSRVEDYGARIDELRSKYVGYEIANRWLSRAWLADLVLSRIKRSPVLTQHVEDLLHERVDPREIFSVAGLVRSLVH